MRRREIIDSAFIPVFLTGLFSGTLQLTLSSGEENGALEERENLVDIYVGTIVHQGFNGMPSFKPKIIKEQQLEAVAAYFADQVNKVVSDRKKSF